jgi:hypothetical protein
MQASGWPAWDSGGCAGVGIADRRMCFAVETRRLQRMEGARDVPSGRPGASLIKAAQWLFVAIAAIAAGGCSGTRPELPADVSVAPLDQEAATDEGTLVDAVDASTAAMSLTVVTFNTGSAGGGDPDTGFGSVQEQINQELYGSGLAWVPYVSAVESFMAELDPDIVAFQEIFAPIECAEIPAEAHAGFVCETWKPGDPSVAESVLGPDFEVACHPDKPDKCVGLHRRVGTWRGPLFGTPVADCGSGARVARGVIDRIDGSVLTIVSVHGTSGLSDEESDCRVKQVEQVFVDVGDGAPGANGAVNVVLGDLNTDPGRFAPGEASAERWNDFVGPGLPFGYLTEVGLDARPGYGGVFNIDHVISDGLVGDCWIAGVSPGRPGVATQAFFDHRPVVCLVTPP